MVGATEDIFVQAIHDYLASSMALGGGRVALLGDAGAILRPHTAAGTTKAAVNAWVLARCLKRAGFEVLAATARYSEAMRAVGRELVDVGVAIGTKSQFPKRAREEGGTGGF
jgi:2-polyprenyl-6-methoxyphenol hydroxylase-like FAD-dependent oxidoreductase